MIKTSERAVSKGKDNFQKLYEVLRDRKIYFQLHQNFYMISKPGNILIDDNDIKAIYVVVNDKTTMEGTCGQRSTVY